MNRQMTYFQVVAPVRATCAQVLGVVVKLMSQGNVGHVVELLLVLAREGQWEVRHASLMGTQHLLAARTVSWAQAGLCCVCLYRVYVLCVCVLWGVHLCCVCVYKYTCAHVCVFVYIFMECACVGCLCVLFVLWCVCKDCEFGWAQAGLCVCVCVCMLSVCYVC